MKVYRESMLNIVAVLKRDFIISNGREPNKIEMTTKEYEDLKKECSHVLFDYAKAEEIKNGAIEKVLGMVIVIID